MTRKERFDRFIDYHVRNHSGAKTWLNFGELREDFLKNHFVSFSFTHL